MITPVFPQKNKKTKQNKKTEDTLIRHGFEFLMKGQIWTEFHGGVGAATSKFVPGP